MHQLLNRTTSIDEDGPLLRAIGQIAFEGRHPHAPARRWQIAGDELQTPRLTRRTRDELVRRAGAVVDEWKKTPSRTERNATRRDRLPGLLQRLRAGDSEHFLTRAQHHCRQHAEERDAAGDQPGAPRSRPERQRAMR